LSLEGVSFEFFLYRKNQRVDSIVFCMGFGSGVIIACYFGREDAQASGLRIF
jgi:hypothetical protein